MRVGDGDPVLFTKANMLSQAQTLMRNLNMFTDSLPDLPSKRTIVLKLKYHPHTPDEYEPQFFRAASAEAYSRFASSPKKVLLGGLKTEFHGLSLTFTGANWLFDESSDDEDEEKSSDLSQDKEVSMSGHGYMDEDRVGGACDGGSGGGDSDVDNDDLPTQPVQPSSASQSALAHRGGQSAPASTPAPDSPRRGRSRGMPSSSGVDDLAVLSQSCLGRSQSCLARLISNPRA